MFVHATNLSDICVNSKDTNHQREAHPAILSYNEQLEQWNYLFTQIKHMDLFSSENYAVDVD